MVAALSPSQQIDARIKELGDWRGKTLARIRALIQQAVPEVVEEWKWRGVPVWEANGQLCTGETYKAVVKLTFLKGASLPDPARLFNSSLEGHARRAIDIHEGEPMDESAFKTLIRAAATLNGAAPSKASRAPAKRASEPKAGSSAVPAAAAKPKLLAGGNPQIAMAAGHAPVQAYIAAMPGWKSEVGRRLDELIMRNVPAACKAVKWNSPFYGMAGQGWFVSFHVFEHYIKLTFFKGLLLKPAPKGGTAKEARWIDIQEGEWEDKKLQAQLTKWIREAAALPGWGKCP